MPGSALSYDLIGDAAPGSLVALGRRLKEAHLLRNWTQAAAAAKPGLSESLIRKVEADSKKRESVCPGNWVTVCPGN